ncbi:3-deoxy-D-manno-octulosonic acid transferase [Candidatus Paracaedibacter symbiosus]|uniref:3-deoxy-D-manno-octulosonic acid transferase n=1 Tax=Candidatus Paracaedibacter symbiosus TaxID=244582 RepID=UPI000AAFD9A5|nr:3-deoxy-D-manno-octulosonic acid transferase [Candidatus Paracaedibacter symbiosus]
MLNLYRWLIQTLAPLLKYHLKRRLKRGKEDPVRLCERFGGASFSRPQGQLVWFHGASVGESISMLKLIDQLLEIQPELHVLVTTGTVTSAKLLAKHLPKRCIHQFIPLDVPRWTSRFLNHWKPDLAVFIESEFWPNLLRGIKKRQIPLILLNARMSKRSFDWWRRFPNISRQLLQLFDACFTPSEQAFSYLKELGAKNVSLSCNLKFAADTLGYAPEELDRLRNICEKRLVWAATSTHKGEEEIVIARHLALKQRFPNLLTILAPRHPERAAEILQMVEKADLRVVRRSEGNFPRQKTDIWLVDTIGDLGLVYSIAKVCFIGGSFVTIGGHNPIEAFKLGSAVIVGPHTENFLDVNENLKEALIQVQTTAELEAVLQDLLTNEEETRRRSLTGQTIIIEQQQGLPILAEEVLQHLSSAHKA